MKVRDEIKRLITHAQRYGVEGVMETARDEGLTLTELEHLLVECDRIEATAFKKNYRFATAKKHRLTVEQRVRRLCGIPEDEETAQ